MGAARCASPRRLCGLVGLKPTIGVVGRDGAPRWIDFSGWGVTGHSVDDVIAEASVYLGPTVGDVRSLPAGAIDMSLDANRHGCCFAGRFVPAVQPVIETATRKHRFDARRPRIPRGGDREPGTRCPVLDWGVISVA